MLRHRSRMYPLTGTVHQLGVYDKFRLPLHGIYLSLFDSPSAQRPGAEAFRRICPHPQPHLRKGNYEFPLVSIIVPMYNKPGALPAVSKAFAPRLIKALRFCC